MIFERRKNYDKTKIKYKTIIKILTKFVYNFLSFGLNLDVLLFFANVYIYLRQWEGEIELKPTLWHKN